MASGQSRHHDTLPEHEGLVFENAQVTVQEQHAGEDGDNQRQSEAVAVEEQPGHDGKDAENDVQPGEQDPLGTLFLNMPYAIQLHPDSFNRPCNA